MFNLVKASAAYQGQPVLHDITLKIEPGEQVILLGRSGAGKSTLLNLLYEQQKQKTALVPQGYGLVSTLSVFHNIFAGQLKKHSVLFNLRNLVWPIESEIEKIRPLARQLGLEDVLFKRAGEISGGQQQRTAVGRALFCGGDALLADEPVSAVDVAHTDAVLDAIAQTFSTSVLAMHDIDLAMKIASRIVGIREGRILFDGPAATISDEDMKDLYR